MIKSLRERVGWYLLNRRRSATKREVKPQSIEKVKSALILASLDERDEAEAAEVLLKDLLKSGVDADLLCYTFKNKLEDHIFGDEHRIYLTRKDLNWFFIPTYPAIPRLVKKGHDILIDLNLKMSFPLTFALAASNAQFKVGQKVKDKEIFLDFMIELKEGDGVHQLVAHLDNYLKLFDK